MHTLIVYYSDFGNTKKLAEKIAESPAEEGQAHVVSTDQLTAADLRDTDLAVMGSPTHYQNLPKIFQAALETLPRGALEGKAVAAFDTSVETWGPLMRLTAAHKLLRKMRKLGGRQAAKPETFLVKQRDREDEGQHDLLYDGEVERARDWATALLDKLEASSG
ncbi:flavodoxin family protein [Chloroflexota bacterium]